MHYTNDNQPVVLNLLASQYIPTLHAAFKKADWHKPREIFEDYLQRQHHGELMCLIASFDEKITGYITMVFFSQYPHLNKNNIPEIRDLNILPEYRGKGIANILMEEAENILFIDHPTVCCRVGVYQECGDIQQLVIRRGYIPDGNGLFNQNGAVHFGDSITVDDDIVFLLIKNCPLDNNT